MSTRATRWIERQQRAASKRVRIEILDCRLEWTKRGYKVTIAGKNLHGVWSPPRVSIGGEPVSDLAYVPDGTQLTGRMRDKPKGRQVVVDYGFARAEFELPRKGGKLYFLRHLLRHLPRWISLLRRRFLAEKSNGT